MTNSSVQSAQSTLSSHAEIDFSLYNILLVDDTPHNLDILVEFLKEYGFGLRVARTGESALQRVSYDAPDIVLLDVLLPGMDGFETCRQLKADIATADIPIIFMTSLANAEDKVRGFEVGAVDYVTKPLQQAEVMARITTHLRQREMTQHLQAENQRLIHSHQVEKERLLEAVVQQRTQLRTLTTKLTEVQERERQRLARELHDELGQALTAIRMNLGSIEKEASNAEPSHFSPRLHERLHEAAQITDDTLEQIRELALDLRPAMLDDLGLIPTLRWYIDRFAKRTNILVDFQAHGINQQPRFMGTLEVALYRIIQESLTNVARHAEATKVWLTLTKNGSNGGPEEKSSSNVLVTIEDNGCGFEPAVMWAQMGDEPIIQHKVQSHEQTMMPESGMMGGIGLLGINERVTLLGGNWQIESAPDSGTRIQIQLPLEHKA